MPNDNIWDEHLILELGFRVARAAFLQETSIEAYLWALSMKAKLLLGPDLDYVVPDVQAYKLTERAAMPREIREKMAKVLEDDYVDEWWTSPVPRWKYATPREMWYQDPQKVHDLVDSYLDPSYS